MHTSVYSGCRIHHGSDFEGPMYLSVKDEESNVEVIITLDTLRKLSERIEAEFTPNKNIELIAPEHLDNQDRFDVCEQEKKSWIIKPGVWKLATVSIPKEDVHAILLDSAVITIGDTIEKAVEFICDSENNKDLRQLVSDEINSLFRGTGRILSIIELSKDVS